ncbi:uncharacterized threonine-rich GPI-anchored glycoprotein PJ4664.02-like [Stylophora pistillata]|uniref:Uncharacterized protein n=1 Tax=Stylophora pistillata TaxID=50429 RepID=A0A2B4RMG2_STYPI|nr:uncharacterized threonine-rich GPI-anchored glycoprotein PJ4664.02-like [Stylophora pistillata]PFX17455.1 hypothetical protein AWC38_SpisGene18213 [Stylophora pistillata]
MADSNAIGFLLFCTLICTFCETPEVKAQNSTTSVLPSPVWSTIQNSVSPFATVATSSTHGTTQIASHTPSNQSYSPQVPSSRYLVTSSSVFGVSSNGSVSSALNNSSSSSITVQLQTSIAVTNRSTAVSPVASHSTIIKSMAIKSSAISTKTEQSTTMISSQVTKGKTATSTPSKSQSTSSSVITKRTPTTASPAIKDDRLSLTEQILIACLAVFFFVLIAMVVLVIQIVLLNKSVNKLKATSRR